VEALGAVVIEMKPHLLTDGKDNKIANLEPNTSQFFEYNTELPPEIIEGFVHEGQVITVSGPYGVGKSPLLQHITICRLNGIDWCGRAVKRGSVIVFDFETPGAIYKCNLKKLCDRFGVPLPNVPDELEVYLEHDDLAAPGTTQLLKLLEQSTKDKIKFIRERLKEKPDALVIIDPLELLFTIDKNKGVDVVKLYNKFRRLLAEFPHACILLTFNMRKQDRRAKMPNLLTDPRGWLEETSGNGAIQYRADVRLGVDWYDDEKEIRVFNGIRRGERMEPLLIKPAGDLDNLAGFELSPADEVDLMSTLPPKQQEYWKKLPDKFLFDEMADKGVPRTSLDRLTKRAKSLGILDKQDGYWVKLWN